MGNHIQRTRSIFKYAWDADLIERPVKFGPMFKKPSKKVRRKVRRAARKAAGPRMFEADQIRALLDESNTQMRAMILLGINCAFGNTDVATLPRSRVNLERGWHDFERVKTAVDRRCPLWPETLRALVQT